MYKITGQIKLITPMLFNKPTSAALKDKSPEKDKIADAYNKVHSHGHGVCIPSDMIVAGLCDGSDMAALKQGKKGLSQYLRSVVVASDVLFRAKKPDSIFKHPGRIPPRTGPTTMLYRPMMKAGRILEFEFVVTDDTIRPESVRAAWTATGLYGLLGAWRKKFGKFHITKWQVKK